MQDRLKRSHPALKHGAYSAMGVLPGESTKRTLKNCIGI
jgi:hypothetical protein